MARASILGTCTAIVVTVGFASVAQAADDSFEGYCPDIRGTATVDKPLTFAEAQNVYHFRDAGHCSGKLNGRPVTDTPVEGHSDGPFYGSCSGGHSTSPGSGFMRFTRGTAARADDIVIRTTLTWSSDAVNGTYFQIKGEKSGEGGGYSDVSADAWAGFFRDCAGDGVSSAPYQAGFGTSSPIVSEAPRLLLGAPRGMRQASPGHPFEIRVRASHARLSAAQVVVRVAGNNTVVGRSERFSVGPRGKVVRVSVAHRLADGRYQVIVSGHDATGRELRTTRNVRLQASSK